MAATTSSPQPPSTAVDNAPINCRRLHPTTASIDSHRLRQRRCRHQRPSPTNTPLTAASIDDEDGHQPPTPSIATTVVDNNNGHQRRPPLPSTKGVIATATSFDVDADGGGKDATYRRLPSTARTAIDRRRLQPPPLLQSTMTMAIGAARGCHQPKTSLPPPPSVNVERRYIPFLTPPCSPRVPPVFPHLSALL